MTFISGENIELWKASTPRSDKTVGELLEIGYTPLRHLNDLSGCLHFSPDNDTVYWSRFVYPSYLSHPYLMAQNGKKFVNVFALGMYSWNNDWKKFWVERGVTIDR